MYQIFEITLKRKEVNLANNTSRINSLGWYLDGYILVKDDDGLQYILDLSIFKLKCVMSELFPLDEGNWSAGDFPSREELVDSAMAMLRKLPFNLEIYEVRRIVKRE